MRRLLVLAGAVLCLVLLVYGLVRLFGGTHAGKPAGGEDGSTQASQTAVEPPPSEQPDPTISPAAEPAAPLTEGEARQQRIEMAAAATQGLCTGLQPQITDPATWNAEGKTIIDRLEADIFYVERGFTASAAAYAANGGKRAEITGEMERWGVEVGELPDRYPYLLAVNRAASTVTVYTPDAADRYTVPYMAMACSGSSETPTGFLYLGAIPVARPVRHPLRAERHPHL